MMLLDCMILFFKEIIFHLLQENRFLQSLSLQFYNEPVIKAAQKVQEISERKK